MKTQVPVAAILLTSLTAAASAQFSAPALTLDVAACQLAAVQQAAPTPQPAEPAPAHPRSLSFGEYAKDLSSPWFITIGGGVAGDSDPGTHYTGFAAFSTFIGTGLEFQIVGSGWYFDQSPDSTGGAGIAIRLRWHMLHGAYGGESGWGTNPAGYDWTVFIDAGIGLIFSGDDVPPGGSSVNFAPTAAIGFTARLGDSATRLVVGAGWQHMSNARINGDSNNPDFNAPAVFIGLQWPL